MPQATVLGTIQKQRVIGFLKSEDTFATVLLAILLDNFGTDLFEWEADTIKLEIMANYGIEMPDVNHDKIWSLIVVLTTNQFYVSWELYMAICSALMNQEPDFSSFAPADPEELAWGVTEVLLNDPPDPKDPPEFSNEVERYTGVILHQNSIMEPPKQLGFAEMPTENPVLDLDTAFVDDPLMFEPAWNAQAAKKKEIETFVEVRLKALFAQLADVPLIGMKADFKAKLQAIGKDS